MLRPPGDAAMHDTLTLDLTHSAARVLARSLGKAIAHAHFSRMQECHGKARANDNNNSPVTPEPPCGSARVDES